MSRSRIEDVLDVVMEMEKLFSISEGYIKYNHLRSSAIEIVARRELKKGRFKNFDSAQKSIQDACTRRLRRIHNVKNFEQSVRDWLNDRPNKLKEAIEFETRTKRENLLVSNFFESSPILGENTNSNSLASDLEKLRLPESLINDTTKLESELNNEMLSMYELAGKETGYWGNYFLRSLKKNGGLETAKRILAKRNESQTEQKGFQALIEAGRPDLSLEALVLKPKYAELFSDEEISEAKRRLDLIPEYAKRERVDPENNFPGDVYENDEFTEGSKKRITVNAYERNPKARAACLKRHGHNCKVCGMNFKDVYGEIGKQFIHVHHKKPLAGRSSDYKVNPTTDLVPVCPNCHAMLHTSNPPLGIEELKEVLTKKS